VDVHKVEGVVTPESILPIRARFTWTAGTGRPH
jgi:hypothetical protein